MTRVSRRPLTIDDADDADDTDDTDDKNWLRAMPPEITEHKRDQWRKEIEQKFASDSAKSMWRDIPKPNVQLPSGKWVYHADFEILPNIEEVTEAKWDHANVLPGGLLQDSEQEDTYSENRGMPPKPRRLPCVRPQRSVD
jgi:hypothetical protein